MFDRVQQGYPKGKFKPRYYRCISLTSLMAWSAVSNNSYQIDGAWKSLKSRFSCLHIFAIEIPLIFSLSQQNPTLLWLNKSRRHCLGNFFVHNPWKQWSFSGAFTLLPRLCRLGWNTHCSRPGFMLSSDLSPESQYQTSRERDKSNNSAPVRLGRKCWTLDSLWKLLSNVMIMISTS